MRIALANVGYPSSIDASVTRAEAAVYDAAHVGAAIVCLPECYVPGYRAADRHRPTPDASWLKAAWTRIANAAAHARIAVILGTERVTAHGLRASALVISADGQRAGVQDKVQLDPSEDATYSPGSERAVFDIPGLRFGIAICHEGFRYPETVRWAAQRGAQVVFHPHFHAAEPGAFQPSQFADPANTFHEKAMLCRAAENTVFVATVNCAEVGSPTTSAVINPDGTVHTVHPYGMDGLLVADLDLTLATGLLAARLRTAVDVR